VNQKVYCVVEGEPYPEGLPYGIFATIEEAKSFIDKNVESPLHLKWREKTYIYRYTLGGDGYEAILNYLGEEIK
jgi:hypothetical protein